MDTKKIFVMLLMGIFMISMVSALEFDNVRHYDPVSRTFTINDCNLWVGVCLIEGDVILSAMLDSPLSVKVIPEEDQLVGWFNFQTSEEDVKGTFAGLFLEDKNNNGNPMSRGEQYKVLTSRLESVDDYEWQCGNNPLNLSECERVEIGSHMEVVKEWMPITNPNVDLDPDTLYQIGVFVDVEEGDHGEWIPQFMQFQVPEWAEWESSVWTNLENLFHLDEESGNAVDDVGSNDFTETGTVGNSTGVIGYSRGEYTTGNYFTDNSLSLSVGSDSDFSISIWFKTDVTSASDRHIWYTHPDALGGWGSGSWETWAKLMANNSLQVVTLGRGATYSEFYIENATYGVVDGQWHNVIFSHDAGTDTDVFYDGVNLVNLTQGAGGRNDAIQMEIGYLLSDGSPYPAEDIYLDEFIMWSRTLTQVEVTSIYENATTPDLNAPNITLNDPTANASYTSWQTITFNFTAFDDINLTDVKIYVNDVLNQTNATGLNNTDYLFDLALQDGDYDIYGKATDNDSLETTTEIIGISIDTTPTLTIVDPIVNNSNYTTNTIFFNATSDLAIDTWIVNYNGTNVTLSDINTSINVVDGDLYNLKLYGNNSVSGKWGLNDTYYFSVDATDPVVTAYNLTDLVTITMPINSTWNFTASDTHIDDCYFNTTDHATSVVTCNASINSTWSTGGNKTITYCANDTFGNEACGTGYVYVYSITETQAESSDPTVEGLDVTWNLTIGLTDTPTTTANLIINGSNIYTPTTTTATQNQTYFEYTLNIPATWGNATGILYDWYWNYTIDGVVTDDDTDTENITVYELAVDDCSAYSTVILDLNLFDEELGTAVNESAGANVEIDLSIQSKTNSSISLDYNNTWTNENNPQVCVPNEVINNTQYWMNFTIGFDSTDHVWEFYYLDLGTLNSSLVFDSQTSSPINLYDLETTDSTSFLFNYFDQDGLPVTDAIVHVYRRYIGDGVFKEVERAKADLNGDTIVHLVEEDVIYYFVISQYGEILFTSSQYTALCQATPCTIQIEASGGSAEFPTDWDLVDGGGFQIYTSSSTREVNLTFTNDDSTTFNMTVYKYESDGSYTALNTSGATGTSESFVMTVPQSAGNVSFFVAVEQDGEYLKSEWVDFTQKSSDYFGTTLALFLGALIILTFGLMAVSKGAGTLVWVVLGVIIASAMGLVTTTLSTGVNVVIYLVIAGGILIWKLTGGRK